MNSEAQPSVVLSKNEDMKPIFKAYPFTHIQFQAVENVPYEREKYKLDKEVNDVGKILQEVKMINKESKDNNQKITIDASINLQTEDIREIKESSNVLLSNRNVEKRVVTKRKRVQVSQPTIATLFPIYSIVDDLRNYKVDITIKQLIKMMPRIGNELIKGMHNPIIKTKTKEAHLAGADDSEDNSELITSYCNTSIKNIQFPLIIDFGSTMEKINSYNA